MLKNKKIIGRWAAIIVGLALPLVLIGQTAKAATTKQATVDAGTTVNGRLLSFGNDVNVHGTVNGDIMCAGQHIIIDATVNGDIMCAGQDITIAGKVNGSVRLAGQDIVIQANIARSASVAGQYITLEDGAIVGTDMSSWGANTSINGQVKRDLDTKGAKLEIDGNVGRDVQFAGKTFNIVGTATVGGNVDYTSPSMVSVSTDATVDGDVNQTKPTDAHANLKPAGYFSAGFVVMAGLAFIVAMVLFALAMGLIFPKQIGEVVGVGGHRFGMSVLIGFLGSLVWPALTVLLAVTILGIPLAAFVWTLGAACMLFGWAAVAFWLGSRMITHGTNVAGRAVLGMLILVIVCLIPVLGWIVAIVAGWFGFGMVLMRLNQTLRKPLITNPVTAVESKIKT